MLWSSIFYSWFKVLVRDRIRSLLDPETELWELGMTAGKSTDLEPGVYSFLSFQFVPQALVLSTGMSHVVVVLQG